MTKYFLITVLFITQFVFSQNYYHDTQGVLEISNSGQSVYTLPIALPPSIQNVGPTINLIYSSGQMGGIAGQGWSINSISVISRISTRKDLDGFIDGVDFDSNDKLALDGQRLIIKSGAYWADGSIYETETKSNSKIELKGTGTSIYFIVTNPDGSRAWYGNYGGMNATDLTAFYITRFEDTNSNFITYHYLKPYNKSLCISEIKFSANPINAITPQNLIKFNYKLAKRSENAFIKGVKHEKVELLDYVEVKTNSLLFRKYQLTHDLDSQLAYERVIKIQEFNGALEPSNPVIFEYKNTISTNIGTEMFTTYINNIDFQDIKLSGDFDGDGRLDFIDNTKIYTKLFQNSSGGSTISIPSIQSNFKLPVTTLTNSNKLNQNQSVLYINKPNNSQLEFKVYNLEGNSFLNEFTKTIDLDFSVIGGPLTVNSTAVATLQCYSYFQNNISSFYPTTRQALYNEGDFDGNGISEILISLDPKNYQALVEPFYPNQPYTFNPNDCPITVTAQSNTQYYLVDLDQNQSTNLGTPGYFVLQGTHLSTTNIFAKKFFYDFNGDGKTDILEIIGNTYKVVEIIKTANYAYTSLIGNGTIDALQNTVSSINEKGVLIGDYNGDGKVDIMISNGNGSNSQRDDALWHIYYSNPKPNGGAFFTKESHFIVSYWPNSNTYFDTQTHFNNYYSIDINGDGKSDIVKVWRKHYKPNLTINDHNTQWEVSSYINNTGNTTVVGTKFQLDYISSTNHNSDSPEIPTPIVSSYKYQGLNREIVMVRNHHNEAVYVNFTKDVSSDVLLTKVTSSGNNIVDEITYNSLEPESPGPNGLGSLNQFYSSADSVNYPLVELKRIPTSYLVSQLKKTTMGIVKNQSFKYHGFVVNMNGIGVIGFRKTARSAWYQNDSEKRIWSAEVNNPLWRGATQYRYSQLVTNGSNFTFSNLGIPNNIISSTTNIFSTYLTNNVYNITLDSQTNYDYLTNVKNEITYTYSTPYLLPETVISKNYLNLSILQGTTTTTTVFDNNPSGTGNSYYIGRPLQINTTVSAYSDNSSIEVKYTYTGNKLTKKESKANNTDNVYLTETYEYFANGNLKKKILSAPGAVPSVSSRSTEYTYDTSERFIKTVKDNDGLITTYNSYHPLYGVVLSETNPLAQATVSVFDNWGKRTKVTDYLNKSINYAYSKTGNYYLTTQTGDDGSSSTIEMDALARVIKKGEKNISGQWSYSSTEYDYLNRKLRESEPYFGTSANQWTNYYYDDYSRLIQQVSFTGLTTTITYAGLMMTSNDGTITKSTIKNANGHIISSIDPGGTINYTYFANGDMKTSNFDGIILSMEYDGWGRKKKLTDPSAGVYEYEYNIYGETLKEITPKGITQNYYTPSGRLDLKIIQGDSTYQEIYYGYNTYFQLESIDGIDSSGYPFTTEYFYNTNKQLIKTTESNPQSYFENQFEYDSFGRINREYKKATDVATGKSSNKWIKNIYVNGFHSKILDDATNQILWQIDAVNERGQLLTAKYGNLIGQVTNTYDAYGFPLISNYRTISGSNSSPTPFLTLTTNFNAQRGLLQNRSNSLFNWNETFQYDDLDRLTHFTNAGGQTEQQEYDNKGRITQNSIGTYAYETSAKPYQATNISLSTTGVSYYSDKPLQQISYNAFKSPVSIYEEGKDRIDFEYNPFLTRSTMYYGGLQTDKNLRPYRKHYSSDGSMEIKRNITTNAVEIITYIGGDGYSAPIIIKSNGTTQNYFYLHRDYLGSIMAISNAVGQVVEKRHFDAWGNIVFLKDQNNTNLTTFAVIDRGYTGHEHLQGVGLIHMNGRLYDSKVRRFLSPDNYVQDPSNTQNFNRYGYVLNNPLKYTDSSGEIAQIAVAALIGAGIAALTYTITALTADVPFTAGGLIKSVAIGAFSGTVSFGIGHAATAITELGTRIAFQALTHGVFQGTMTGIQGGDIITGFASGSLSSLASSIWSGGPMKSGNPWSGAGGKFGHTTPGTLAFGTLAGGAGASLTGGNFWQGAATGLIVSGLNHMMHKQPDNNKLLAKKIAGEYGYDWREVKVFLDKNPFVLTHKGVAMGSKEALSSKYIEDDITIVDYVQDQVTSEIQSRVIEYLSPRAGKIWGLGGELLSSQTAHAPDSNYLVKQNQRIEAAKSTLIRYYFQKPATYQTPSMYNNFQSFQYHSSVFDIMNYRFY